MTRIVGLMCVGVASNTLLHMHLSICWHYEEMLLVSRAVIL